MVYELGRCDRIGPVSCCGTGSLPRASSAAGGRHARRAAWSAALAGWRVAILWGVPGMAGEIVTPERGLLPVVGAPEGPTTIYLRPPGLCRLPVGVSLEDVLRICFDGDLGKSLWQVPIAQSS